MNCETICIFTQQGKTFTFRDVNIVINNETMLIFKYTAMSDGLRKMGNFPKNTICGWSTKEQLQGLSNFTSFAGNNFQDHPGRREVHEEMIKG